MVALTVKPGIENIALQECKATGIDAMIAAEGVLTAGDLESDKNYDLCFSSWLLFEAQMIAFEKFTAGAKKIADWYSDSIRSERIEQKWPLVYLVFSENGYTADLEKSRIIVEQLKKKVSRIARLAVPGYPAKQGLIEGLIVVETQKRELLFSRTARFFGQRRMKFDPSAPSRSFLKIEEAFSVMGRSPSSAETVTDLGAAPGGWSYSASKKGARVFAIDNGPLKKGAARNTLIEHLRQDAFLYKPEKPTDWLFCDMVEDPFRVIKLVKKWLKNRLCKHAVVNFKYGHADPVRLLAVIRSKEGFRTLSKNVICRHLYHDRDEFTVIISID